MYLGYYIDLFCTDTVRFCAGKRELTLINKIPDNVISTVALTRWHSVLEKDQR